MNVLGIILLSISLSIDALGVGISYGLRKVKIPIIAKIIIGIISVLFMGIALIIGTTISAFIPPFWTKIIGCGMLVVLGVFIICKAFFEKPEEKKPSEEDVKERKYNFEVKPLGLKIQITRDLASLKQKNSNHIDPLEATYLGVALSIDSFGAGISSAVSGLTSFLIPFVSAAFQILFLCIGSFFGARLSSLERINSKIFVVISGSLLIVLSIIRFFNG